MMKSKEIIHRAGSERMLLSILLNSPDEYHQAISEGLTSQAFAVDAHKYIFLAISRLIELGSKLDSFAILSVLPEKAKKTVDELGGLDYLEALQESNPAPNTKLYASHIIQAAARREIWELAQKVMREAETAEDTPLSDYLTQVEGAFRDITLKYCSSTEVVKLGEGVGDRLKSRALNPQKVIGLSTGWEQFDEATQGLKPGELTIIGGRSKTGKSVTLQNWCKKIAIEDKIPVLYFDTEMYPHELEDRFLSMLSGVPEREIKSGEFITNPEKIQLVQQASKQLREAPFFHIYDPAFTPDKIRSLARKYHLEKGIKLLVFDYIKLPSSSGQLGEKEYQALGYLTSTLKDIAGELQIPVISAVQLNRMAVNATEIHEGMIAGSDRVLQLANRVCFLRNMTEEERITATAGANQKFRVAFQRGGASNLPEIDIRFRGEILRQEPLERIVL